MSGLKEIPLSVSEFHPVPTVLTSEVEEFDSSGLFELYSIQASTGIMRTQPISASFPDSTSSSSAAAVYDLHIHIYMFRCLDSLSSLR